MKTDNYQVLTSKLESFIKKYYKNQLIKGCIYSVSSVLLFFVLVVVLEYFGHFGVLIRAGLFYSFIVSTLLIISLLIIKPLIKLYKLGKIISHEDAAQIIGESFSNVKDKLLNTIQLSSKENLSDREIELTQASIDQRISELKPISFNSAINFAENKRYLKYALPSVLLLLAILLSSPSMITETTNRLINHTEEFNENLLDFIVLNQKLEVVENEDFDFSVQLSGKKVPNDIYLVENNIQFKLRKESKIAFNHQFKKVKKSKKFRLKAGDNLSKEFELKVLPNPAIQSFDVFLNYPTYTKKKDLTIDNTGDIIVPEGTIAKWNFKTKNTDKFKFHLGDSSLALNQSNPGEYNVEHRIFESNSYFVTTENQYKKSSDSIKYYIKVIPDLYPIIKVDEVVDSNNTMLKFFKGEVRDDYGFNRLTFNYKILDQEGKERAHKAKDILIDRKQITNQFYHTWSATELNLSPGDQVEYFFTVWDNDQVNGSKSATTPIKTYKALTKEEVSDQIENENNQIKDQLAEAIKEASKIRNELEDVKRELYDKKEMGWQDKKKIEDLLQRQKELQSQVEKMKQKNSDNINKQEEFDTSNEELLEKQKELEKLMDELVTDEMKEMMKELEELMKKLNKQNIQDKLEDMELSSEELEKELERSLELFKQLEVEQKLQDITEKMEELSKQQEELAKQTENQENSNEELLDKQKELNEKFEKLSEEMEKLQELNDKLESPNNLDEMKEEQQEVKEEMKEGTEKLEKDKNQKASESQQNASDKMKQMSDKLSEMQAQIQGNNMQRDMESLRYLLENLLQMSFDQEALMEELSGLSKGDPKYFEVGKRQRKLLDNSKVIEDSLLALSKRVVQLESIVNKEIALIRKNIDKTLDHIEERKTSSAISTQQHVMTSANNLAVLLDEALNQMQQQMASMKQGGGACQKPGQGSAKSKISLPSLSEMQDQLGKQLEKLKKELEKNGNKPGSKPGDKPGNKPGEGKGKGEGQGEQMSEDLAKAAAKQAAIREKLRELSNMMNSDGSGSGNGLKKVIKEMEKTEEEIINKRITEQTLLRQKQILTKLLESEKAERERKQDKKRESKESEISEFSNPNKYFEYNMLKQKEQEILKTMPPELLPYYRNKVSEYFNKIME